MRDVPDLQPRDEANTRLLSNVHPADWKNPTPEGRYNLVVIGAGTAGLVAAAGAAGLGARVALVERGLMGGDCLNTGCVPSKSVIRSGRLVGELELAGKLGVQGTGRAEVDFPGVMRRMRQVRAGISSHDSAERFRRLGVDVYLGHGRFVADGVVEVEGQRLSYRRAVIATGGRPTAPAIEGLEEAGYLTSETLWSLEERPARLAVIGGGPIGSELAQAFQRLGSEVVLLQDEGQLLEYEDEDAADVLKTALERDGVRVILEARTSRVERRDGGVTLAVESASGSDRFTVDQILVATGQAPNVEGLGLEAVGVEHGQDGVVVDDRMRTTNPRIYAAGDVALDHKFTHAADFSARLVIQNALFFGRKKLSSLTIPRCTYTDPEVAHVGLSERAAAGRGVAIDTYRKEFEKVDRARTDGEEEGFVKVHTEKGSDAILGGTIVGAHAGELIGELTVAMTRGIGLGSLANVIHPYPTRADALRQLGDDYNRTRLTPLVKKLFEGWLAWTR